jgi:hypothetical protein
VQNHVMHPFLDEADVFWEPSTVAGVLGVSGMSPSWASDLVGVLVIEERS